MKSIPSNNWQVHMPSMMLEIRFLILRCRWMERNCSTLPFEVPLHDDMDHNRFASVIRKDVPDMDSLERKRVSENHYLSVRFVFFPVAILQNLSLIHIEGTVSKFRFRCHFLNHFLLILFTVKYAKCALFSISESAVYGESHSMH